MADDKRHISDMVAQGWEISGFSTAYAGMGLIHTLLLKKQRQHKVVVIRKRPVLGVSIEELDV
jgi:hypothetical protein